MEVGLGIIVSVCVGVIVLVANGTGVSVWVAVNIGVGKDWEEQAVNTKTNKRNNFPVFNFILLNFFCKVYLFEYSAGAKNTITVNSSSIEWKRCSTFFVT